MLHGNEIIFENRIGATEYNEWTEIEALMLFPADEQTRHLYWAALERQELIVRLKDNSLNEGWPQPIEKHELELLAEVLPLDKAVDKRIVPTARRRGFLSGNYLRYLIRSSIHHRNKNIARFECWVRYVEKVFSRKKMERSVYLQAFARSAMPITEKALGPITEQFLPVAHFWSASFDDDGRENGVHADDWGNVSIRHPGAFSMFMGRAEGYRQLAEELGVYDMANLDANAVLRVPTHILASDPDSEQTWMERIADFEVVPPVLDPLPQDVVAALQDVPVREPRG